MIGLAAYTYEGLGSIPGLTGQGIKIPQVV